jgi:hypothetical protein
MLKFSQSFVILYLDSNSENYIKGTKFSLIKGRIIMRKTRLIGTLILCMIMIAMLMPTMASAEKIKQNGQIIYDGDYEEVNLWALALDAKIEIIVKVVSPSDAKVDVYILSLTERSNYQNGVNFNPKVAYEDISSKTFNFKNTDGGDYYLIIDNMDNSKTTDAVPTGDVTVDYEYDNPLSAIIGDVEDAVETAFWICIAGIVIIVVVIIVIIVVVIKVASKGKQPPAQPPQQPYPQQYQQPYQQPPPGSYPPPQQPYDQPPPQQPVEQPPNQPQQQRYYPPPDQQQ